MSPADLGEDPVIGADMSISQVWAGYNFLLGFLVVFRTQQAYSRYWESATLLQQTRGEWFIASSSLIAFVTNDENRRQEVEEFQHSVVRFVSMLYCAGLQKVSEMKDHGFEIIEYSGFTEQSIQYLDEKGEKCEVIMQWLQRLIVESMNSGVVPVPAPIITRVFQELSRGMVNLNNARKVREIPFPFPYAQLVSIMLITQTIFMPIYAGILLNSAIWAPLLTFVSILSFWGVNAIAEEIEQPFGDDPNDLPLHELQRDLNRSLWTLLEPMCQQPPEFIFTKEQHRKFKVMKSYWTDGAQSEGGHAEKTPRMSTLRSSSFEDATRRSVSMQSNPKFAGAGFLPVCRTRSSTRASRSECVDGALSGGSQRDFEARGTASMPVMNVRQRWANWDDDSKSRPSQPPARQAGEARGTELQNRSDGSQDRRTQSPVSPASCLSGRRISLESGRRHSQQSPRQSPRFMMPDDSPAQGSRGSDDRGFQELVESVRKLSHRESQLLAEPPVVTEKRSHGTGGTGTNGSTGSVGGSNNGELRSVAGNNNGGFLDIPAPQFLASYGGVSEASWSAKLGGEVILGAESPHHPSEGPLMQVVETTPMGSEGFASGACSVGSGRPRSPQQKPGSGGLASSCSSQSGIAKL